jgi:hypothetical protein
MLSGVEETGDGLFSRYCLGILDRITLRQNLMMVGVCQDWNEAPPKSAVLLPEPVFSFIICADKLKLCHYIVIIVTYVLTYTVRA